ncbi:MAG: metallophosphoesterase [Bacilli bacterium]|nr:metallophosphoesterase [Bacilli bacterium]
MKSRYKLNEKKRKKERRAVYKKKYKKFAILLVIVLLLLLIWGKFVEPNMLVINDYKVETQGLPNSFNGVRIVHFSDLHYGLTKEKRLEKIIKTINSLHPDIVVFTGDLVDLSHDLTDDDIKVLVNNLKNIDAKLGKYAIYGNHDVKNSNYDDIMYDAKITVLKNNYDAVYNKTNEGILIYGLDDTLEGTPKINSIKNKEVKNIKNRIVLVHEPDYINNFIYDYDASLVLSGHSHGIQVNVLGANLFLPKGSKKYYKDYYEVSNTPLYISNGVGNTGINFRLFSVPSINLYRLYTS